MSHDAVVHTGSGAIITAGFIVALVLGAASMNHVLGPRPSKSVAAISAVIAAELALVLAINWFWFVRTAVPLGVIVLGAILVWIWRRSPGDDERPPAAPTPPDPPPGYLGIGQARLTMRDRAKVRGVKNEDQATTDMQDDSEIT